MKGTTKLNLVGTILFVTAWILWLGLGALGHSDAQFWVSMPFQVLSLAYFGTSLVIQIREDLSHRPPQDNGVPRSE